MPWSDYAPVPMFKRMLSANEQYGDDFGQILQMLLTGSNPALDKLSETQQALSAAQNMGGVTPPQRPGNVMVKPDESRPLSPHEPNRFEIAARRGAPMEQPRDMPLTPATEIAALLRGAPMEQPNERLPLTEDAPAPTLATVGGGAGGGGGGGSSYAQIAMNRFGDAYPQIIARAMEEAEMRRQVLNMRRFGIPMERVASSQGAANLGAGKFAGSQQRVPTLANLRLQSVIGSGPRLFNQSAAGQEWARRQGGQSTPGLRPAAAPEQQNEDQRLAMLLQQLLERGGF